MSYSITYHPQAEAALSSLDADERNRVVASIRRLASSSLSDSNIARLTGIVGWDPAYVFRTGNDLSVLFTANDGNITVFDVLNQAFAERYG